jgi:hypothetical protein
LGIHAGAKEILAGPPYPAFNDVRYFDVFYQWISDSPFYLCVVLIVVSEGPELLYNMAPSN